MEQSKTEGISFIEMGEGVVAPFGTPLSTSAMYSCVGVTFTNQRKPYGLYHYPAKSLDDYAKATMIEMIKEIQPQNIHLTPAAKTAPGMGSTDDDLDRVEIFLRSKCPDATIERLNPRSLASVGADDGTELELNEASELESNTIASVLDGVAQIDYTAMRKQVGPGIVQFGKSLERDKK